MPSIHIMGADDKGAKAAVLSCPTERERDHDKTTMDFERAVSLTGHGKFHHLLMLACGLCLVSMISETLSTSYLLPSAQCDFNMASNEKGLLNAVTYVGMIISSYLWGYLADTKGRRKILIFTLFTNSLCTLIAGFMPTFWLYLILRFFNGFFICGPSAVAFAYLGEFHSERTRTRAMVWVCVFISLGVGAQPGLAWLIIPQNWSFELPWYTFNSWRFFALACGLPSVLSGIFLVLFMPESPKFLLAAGREHEALDALRYMYAMNTDKDPSHFPVKALELDAQTIHETSSNSPLAILQHMWRQTKPIFQSPYILSTVVACFIQFGLYASSNGFLLWVPDLFNRMGQYLILHPDETPTVCQAVEAMAQFEAMGNNSLDVFSENLTQSMTSNQLDVTQQTEFLLLQFFMNSTSEGSVILNEISYHTFDNSSDVPPETGSCNSDVDPLAFQNTLIIGLVSSLAYMVIGYLITFVPKKILLLVLMVSSGSSGIGMYFAQSYFEILILSGCFLVLSGMCVSVVNSVVIDVFPTHLRATALCMSLMMGRVGTVTCNMMLGLLIELNCALVIFMLSIGVIGCGLMSLLLPSPKGSTL